MGIVSAMMQVGAAIKHAVAALFTVDHSLRFDGSNDYLSWSSPSASNRTTNTISLWFKTHVTNVSHALFQQRTTGTLSDPQFLVQLRLVSGENRLRILDQNSGNQIILDSNSDLTFSANTWYHLVVSVDTTQTTNTDRVKVWVNGQPYTNWSSPTWPSTNYQTGLNRSGTRMLLGVQRPNGSTSLDTYTNAQLAEVHFIDGQALTASDFGKTRNGQWVPKEVTGVTYGTNGFYLPFDRRPEGVTVLLDGSSTTSDVTGITTITTSSGITAKTASSAGLTADAYGDSNGYVLDGYDAGLYLTGSGSTFSFNDDFTLEAWVYLDSISTNNTLFRMGNTALIGHKGLNAPSTTTGTWVLYLPNANDTSFGLQNQTLFTGLTTGSWKHIAFTKSGNTYRGYVNGNQTSGNIVDTTAGALAADVLRLGITGSYGWRGKMQDVRFTRGIARDIAAGFNNSTPISGGVYSSPLTNDIKYGSLGRDATTNSNDFTVNGGITPDDQLIDTPNLRFATWDRINTNNGMLFSEANLGLQAPNNSTWYNTLATQPIGPSDKIYFEWSNNQSTYLGYMGLSDSLITSSAANHLGETDASYGFFIGNATTLKASHDGTDTNISTSTTTGPRILMCAIDRPNGEIHFGFNGVWMDGTNSSTTPIYPFYTNVPTTGNYYAAGSAATYGSVIYNLVSNFGQDHTFAGAKSPLTTPFTDDDGNGEFYYEPPPGFKALAESY